MALSAVPPTWQEIADKVRNATHEKVGANFPAWDQFWEAQTARFPVVDYTIHDWQDTASVIAAAINGIPPLHGGWNLLYQIASSDTDTLLRRASAKSLAFLSYLNRFVA